MRKWYIVIMSTFLLTCQNDVSEKAHLFKIQGKTMGTYYIISYFAPKEMINKAQIDQLLLDFNQELSTYILSSTISRFNKSNKQLENSILGTVGREERPIDPGERGFVSLRRLLSGITDDLRKKRRKIMKFASKKDIVEVAQEIKGQKESAKVVIIASEEMIDREKKHDSRVAENVFDVPE